MFLVILLLSLLNYKKCVQISLYGVNKEQNWIELNRLFYSCVLSYLASDCKRGWRWPRFDTDLSAVLI